MMSADDVVDSIFGYSVATMVALFTTSLTDVTHTSLYNVKLHPYYTLTNYSTVIALTLYYVTHPANMLSLTNYYNNPAI